MATQSPEKHDQSYYDSVHRSFRRLEASPYKKRTARAFRVCHVCSAHSTDDSRIFHRMCTCLADAGYDVHLIGQSSATGTFQLRGVTIHPLPRWQSRRDRLWARFRIARLSQQLAPDLFHVHEPELLGPVVSVAGSRPVVWDVHESYLDLLSERAWIPRWLRPPAAHLWNLRERHWVGRCAAVVVVTEAIAERYYRLHPNVRVVANYPCWSEIEQLPVVARDGRTCVFAGMLSPERGLSQLLQALALLHSRGLSLPLVLAGPADKSYLRELLAEAERLKIGQLVDYRGVLKRAEALVLQHQASIGVVPYLPSRNASAGIANKLLEAMAVGLPVVFSDFPIYRQIAGAAGAGLPVDATKPGEIAIALERLVRDERLAKEMGEAGRRAIRERFNWEAEHVTLLDLYRKVLAQGLPAPIEFAPAISQ